MVTYSPCDWLCCRWVIPCPIAFVLVPVLTPPPRGWAGLGCGHHSDPTEGPQPSFPWVSVGALVGPLWPEWKPHGPPTHARSLQVVWFLPAGAGWVGDQSSGIQPLGAPSPPHVLSLPQPARVRFAIKNDNLYFFLLYFDKH